MESKEKFYLTANRQKKTLNYQSFMQRWQKNYQMNFGKVRGVWKKYFRNSGF